MMRQPDRKNSSPSRLRPGSFHRAFTLAEVLATLVLIGVVLPVAMRGISVSLRAASSARHEAEAAQLADGKVAEFLLDRDSTTFNGNGDFGADWPEYRWQSAGQLSDGSVYQVTVTVTWTDGGIERSLALTTLVYPASSTESSTAAAGT